MGNRVARHATEVAAWGRNTPVALDFLVCLLFALILRFATFGDPNLHIDEAFYFYVGQQMHHGALPYVDIWDRKPLGLFILYWAMAGISSSVWSYQIAAWLSAAYTAFAISRIAGRWSNRLAGLLAAASYLALLHPLNGHGGQSPVFYNALIVSAAWLVLRSDIRLREGTVPWSAWLAMVLCGLALTVKQTTLFESVFFGLWLLWRLIQAQVGLPRLLLVAIAFGAIGVLPTASIAAWYAASGYWFEFWFAMVTSNLVRPHIPGTTLINPLVVLHALSILTLATGASLFLGMRSKGGQVPIGFLIGWLVFGFVGFAVVGNFFDHYALPLIVPMCVTAAIVYAHGLVGRVFGATVVMTAMAMVNPFDFAFHRASIDSFGKLEQVVEGDTEGRVFIYDGPVLLNSSVRRPPITKLVFPNHINSIYESGTSYVDSGAELARIVALKPSTVVTSDRFEIPPDAKSYDLLSRYLAERCRLMAKQASFQKRNVPFNHYAFRCNG